MGWLRFGPFCRRLGSVGLACLLLASTSCSLLHSSTSQSKAGVKSLQPSKNGARNPVTLTMLQAQVMRFADDYATTVAQAADEFSAKITTPEARVVALRWKLEQATSAYINAAEPNPVLNTLDLLVLVTLARMVMEDYLAGQNFGEAGLLLLETHRKLEADAWSLANDVLKPDQQRELKELIQEWRQKNPRQLQVGAFRFREFVKALGKMPEKQSTAPNSVFSLLFLDPLAGLNPTAAAIQETRLLGERAMYYAQRMPALLSWQTKLLAYQLAVQPESKQVLSDVQRLAGAAESFAKTAEQLPGLVDTQREAAIKQLFDGLASEEAKARTLLAEARQTLSTGNEMAASVNAAIKSLDEFVRFVTPSDTNQASASTNSKPFDVLDYGRAAGQVGAAAKDLSALLASVNQSAPAVARLSQQTSADAERVVQHAFRLGLALILVLLGGSVLAGLIYRLIANKWLNGSRPSTTMPPEDSQPETKSQS